MLVTSSSAVYGEPRTLPVTEEAALQPATDYAASKAAQEMVAVANQRRGMDVVRVRPFNLLGPRQPPSLVISAIAGQIVAAERSGVGVIRIGSTATRRDYTDVRDAVRAYVAVAEDRSLSGVYNVCSGRSVSIQECLDRLIAMSEVAVRVESDADLRPESRYRGAGRQPGAHSRRQPAGARRSPSVTALPPFSTDSGPAMHEESTPCLIQPEQGEYWSLAPAASSAATSSSDSSRMVPGSGSSCDTRLAVSWGC